MGELSTDTAVTPSDLARAIKPLSDRIDYIEWIKARELNNFINSISVTASQNNSDIRYRIYFSFDLYPDRELTFTLSLSNDKGKSIEKNITIGGEGFATNDIDGSFLGGSYTENYNKTEITSSNIYQIAESFKQDCWSVYLYCPNINDGGYNPGLKEESGTPYFNISVNQETGPDGTATYYLSITTLVPSNIIYGSKVDFTPSIDRCQLNNNDNNIMDIVGVENVYQLVNVASDIRNYTSARVYGEDSIEITIKLPIDIDFSPTDIYNDSRSFYIIEQGLVNTIQIQYRISPMGYASYIELPLNGMTNLLTHQLDHIRELQKQSDVNALIAMTTKEA